LVALDWTDVGRFHTLVAAAVVRGRSVPLVWASYTDGQLFRSCNALEEGLLRLLVSMLPAGVRVIRLADRGFGRTELANTCRALGVRFFEPDLPGRPDRPPVLPRGAPGLPGREGGVAGALRGGVPVRPGGHAQRCGPVAARAAGQAGRAVVPDDRPFGQRGEADGPVCPAGGGRGAVPGHEGRPVRGRAAAHPGEPAGPADPGAGPGDHPAGRAGAGGPGAWGSSNDPNECSDLTVGRRMLDRIDEPPERLIDEVVRATLLSLGNWG